MNLHLSHCGGSSDVVSGLFFGSFDDWRDGCRGKTSRRRDNGSNASRGSVVPDPAIARRTPSEGIATNNAFASFRGNGRTLLAIRSAESGILVLDVLGLVSINGALIDRKRTIRNSVIGFATIETTLFERNAAF